MDRSEDLRAFYFPAIHREPYAVGAHRGDTDTVHSVEAIQFARNAGRPSSRESADGQGRQNQSKDISPPEEISPRAAADILSTLSDAYPRSNPPRSLREDEVTLVADEGTDTLESSLSQTLHKSSRLSAGFEDELSVPSNLHLDLQPKSFRRPLCLQKRGYDQEGQDGISISREPYQQPQPPDDQSVTEPLHWVDTLGEHPYHSLGGGEKLSNIDTWSLKLRHKRPPQTRPRKKRVRARTGVDAATEEDKEALLPKVMGVSTTVIDTEADMASPVVSPPGTPVNIPPQAGPTCGSIVALTLVLGERSRPSSSVLTPLSGASATPPLTGSDLHTRSGKETTDETKNSSGSTEELGGGNCLDDGKGMFHCTFCLKPCRGQQEWKEHEQSQHMLQEEWICLPWGLTTESDSGDTCVFCGAVDPDTSHFLQHRHEPCFSRSVADRTYTSREALQKHLRTAHDQPEMTDCMEDWSWPPEDNTWYWACGFCDGMLASWKGRAEHIYNHFKEGKTMASWDPLTPSYPLDRTSLTCPSWFYPEWDPQSLWALQLEHQKEIRRIHDVKGQPHCRYCDSCFGSEEDLQRHEETWHLPRNAWLCPTMDDVKDAIHLQTGPLARYLFPGAQTSTARDEDACPYCGKTFFYSDDWDVRLKHLELDHHDDRCRPACEFLRRDLAILHFAGVHGVKFSDWTAEVMESCRVVRPPLAVVSTGRSLSLPSAVAERLGLGGDVVGVEA